MTKAAKKPCMKLHEATSGTGTGTSTCRTVRYPVLVTTTLGHQPITRKLPAKKPREPKTKPKVWESSVTMVAGSIDVDPSLLQVLHSWMQTACQAGKLSLERGNHLAHLHIQEIIRIFCANGQACNSLIKKALGWDVEDNKPSTSARVQCVAPKTRSCTVGMA